MVKEVMIPQRLWKEEFRFLKVRNGRKEPTADMSKWQERNFKFNDTELLNHLSKGGNYGLIGGFGNLVLIDSDSQEVTDIAEKLTETFTIKTGSPESYKKHFIFITDKKIKPIRLSENSLGDLGDVRSVGQYVVAPNSIHPSGGKYEVILDLPIAKISEEQIRVAFKKFIDPKDNTEFKEYPISTKLRNTKFVRECNVPDYILNNKLKSNTSKNWRLFPYIIDILHCRQPTQKVYEQLAKSQGHDLGAVKGWVKLAHEGKLAKTSCRLMREYLEKFHPEILKDVCGNCKLCKVIEKKESIKSNINYSEVQKEVLMLLASRQKDEATELIVKEIEKDNYIYTTRDDIKSEMWIYQNGIYVPQGKSFIRECCRKILHLAFTPQLANNIIAKVEADTFIEHDEFFSVNYVNEVPLENGILNIKTRKLNEFDPTKVFFNKLPIIYDEVAECPNIIKHFKTVLKHDDDVPVIVELFGFLLLKDYMIEKAFMFVGKGRNGKSKTLELMKRFLGPNNCAALPLKALHEESFSLSELFGKMANLAADLSHTDLKETGIIKSLIGRDTVQAHRKFLRDLNFVNYAKMVFAANELPKVYDTTDGFWTKWVLIEFPHHFMTQKEIDNLPQKERNNKKIIDPEIINKISTPEEMSGLLNLALDGLDKVIEEKNFSYSKGTSEVKDLWIRQSDSFTSFCIDEIIEDSNGAITKKDLRKKFHKYCKKHNISGASDVGIKITLENNFGVSDYRNVDFNWEWRGISWKSG